MLTQTEQVTHQFPRKLAFLRRPARFKVLYGGRGGTKSWGIARQLLLDARDEKLLVLCTREIQKSIEESVYRLLVNQIKSMQLDDFYEIQKTKIIGANGSEFVFAGLRHNMDNLKSFEGANRVWVEEAHVVSKASWDKLIPTIRAEGSEIWISFNPELEDDYTYQHFVVDPPANAEVVKINYYDNPWFPEVLRDEMEDCKRRSQADYDHIWAGKCKQAIDGAIFAEEMHKAAEEHRITTVRAEPGVPVQTFWDLGQSDNTCIWFVQLVGLERRVIDYYQSSGQKFGHYIDVLVKRGYRYGDHHLPHDAEHDQLAAAKNIKQQLEDAIRNNEELSGKVLIIDRVAKKALAIDAARKIFELCWFDKEKCSDGLQCLRRYRFKRDDDTGKVSKEPVHDQWSHGADAFMQMGQHAKIPAKKKPQKQIKTNWVR